MPGILIIAEHLNGVMRDISMEMIGAAASIKDGLRRPGDRGRHFGRAGRHGSSNQSAGRRQDRADYRCQAIISIRTSPRKRRSSSARN